MVRQRSGLIGPSHILHLDPLRGVPGTEKKGHPGFGPVGPDMPSDQTGFGLSGPGFAFPWGWWRRRRRRWPQWFHGYGSGGGGGGGGGGPGIGKSRHQGEMLLSGGYVVRCKQGWGPTAQL